MAATAVIAAIGLALAIGTYVEGQSDKAKARRISEGNQRPTLAIAPEEKANQSIAEDMAGRGLSEDTKQYYLSNTQRGLSSSIDAILKGGGDANAVGQVYGGYNDALGKLALLDDQRHVQNINTLMYQNRMMSEQRDKLFQVNQYAPYADKAKEAAMLYSQGKAEEISGMNSAFKSGSTLIEGAGQAYNTWNVGQKDRTSGDYTTGGSGYGYGNDPNDGVGLMNTPAARQYVNDPNTQPLSDITYNFSKLTPDQRQLVSGLYMNRR